MVVGGGGGCGGWVVAVVVGGGWVVAVVVVVVGGGGGGDPSSTEVQAATCSTRVLFSNSFSLHVRASSKTHVHKLRTVASSGVCLCAVSLAAVFLRVSVS